ncbi:MAG: aminoacetone oxidase family FAD-binding enzyme, partial [Rhodobacteraceae bacterium]
MNPDALVIGVGLDGPMAADRLLSAGCSVLLAEAKPSPARKLLMAGKSGLNITREEGAEPFLAAYAEAADWLRPMLTGFGPAEVQDWMRGYGQEVFTGSTGRVFPKAMKASPLLRAWLQRLGGQGVDLKTRWRWVGEGAFDTPDGRVT